jgi:hypothetical protein
MIGGVCLFMYRLAEHEETSGWLWLLITFVLCLGSAAIPLPFVRILIAGGAAFGAMFLFKLLGD